MVTIEQVQKGLARYIDVQLAGAFEGWQKAVVLAGGVLIARNIPALVDQYAGHPLAGALGVFRDGGIDIDAMHEAFAENLGGEKVPIKLPGIGVIKFGRDDLDALVRYVKEV